MTKVVQRLPPLLLWQQFASPLMLTTAVAASASDVEGLPADVSQVTARLSSTAAKAEAARMARGIRVRKNIVK